ncbi:hypothetical protein QF049_004520 [Paenibacillus sp. W4I10]|nr:hypothetical protein [Paenibacillus sp. W4I10]
MLLMVNFLGKLVHPFPMLEINSIFVAQKAPDFRGLFFA